MKKIKKIILLCSFIVLLFLVIFIISQFLNFQSDRYYLLGKSYENQGYYEKAIISYEKSLNFKEDSVVYNALGNINEFMGKDFAAVVTYQKGIKENYQDVENYYDLARIYYHLGEYNSSEKIVLESISLNPTAIQYLLLGSNYIAMEMLDKAETAIKASIELQESAEAYNDLGYIYQIQEKQELAIENYIRALELNPNYELSKTNLEELGVLF